VGNFYEGL
jgi:ABC-type proline/glycine betaine transport system permease subunit